VRVRSSGYTMRNGTIFFKRPGSSAGWWWWLEFGTAKMPARSFMRTAFESKKNEAMQAAIGHMRVEIDAFFKLHLKKAA
jgi:HK97 gp10 family phage protein